MIGQQYKGHKTGGNGLKFNFTEVFKSEIVSTSKHGDYVYQRKWID